MIKPRKHLKSCQILQKYHDFHDALWFFPHFSLRFLHFRRWARWVPKRTAVAARRGERPVGPSNRWPPWKRRCLRQASQKAHTAKLAVKSFMQLRRWRTRGWLGGYIFDGLVNVPWLGNIKDITWKSSHLVDHIPNGWVMFNGGWWWWWWWWSFFGMIAEDVCIDDAVIGPREVNFWMDVLLFGCESHRIHVWYLC